MYKFIGEAVSKNIVSILPSTSQDAISSIQCSNPQPRGFSFMNFRPESLLNRFSLMSHEDQYDVFISSSQVYLNARAMSFVILWIGFLLAMGCVSSPLSANAATITLTLTDQQLDAALFEACRWYKRGEPEDLARPQKAADAIVRALSMGHYTQGLASIGATMTVQYDRDKHAPAEPWVDVTKEETESAPLLDWINTERK